MKLLSFNYDNKVLFGPKVKKEEAVWDVQKIAKALGEQDFPTSLVEGVASGIDFVEQIRHLCEQAREHEDADSFKYSFEAVEWLSPIPRTPKNVFCVGKNYADHASEMGGDGVPEKLMVFTKSPTAIAADEQKLSVHANLTDQFDYEGELAVIIGKGGRNIPKQLAYDAIFGYTIGNDLTARDVQTERQQFFLGKTMDGSCPLGPYVVTKDEIPDPHNLSIVTKVNDEVRQNGNTNAMVIHIDEIIEELSKYEVGS